MASERNPKMEKRGAPPAATKSDTQAARRAARLVEVSEIETKERTMEGPALEDVQTNYQPEHKELGGFFGAADDEVMDVPYVGWTALFVLGHLRRSESYEDELVRRVTASGFGAARPEVTYQALRQMEKEGMIFSELVGFYPGTFRRRCEITGLGEAYLEYLTNALAQYRREVDLFFRIYNEQPAPGSRGRSTMPSR
jgi:DNA-binding PadR family transcriptional regulator